MLEEIIQFLQETKPQFLVELSSEERVIVDSKEYEEIRTLAIENSLRCDEKFRKFMLKFPEGSWKLGFSGWDDGFFSGYKQRVHARNNGIWHDKCIGENIRKAAEALAEISKKYYGSENTELATDFALCNIFQGWAAGRRAGWCGTACPERSYCGVGGNYNLDRKTEYCKSGDFIK